MITKMIAIDRLHNVAQIKESDWYKRMVTLRVVDRSNNNSPRFIFIYMLEDWIRKKYYTCNHILCNVLGVKKTRNETQMY